LRKHSAGVLERLCNCSQLPVIPVFAGMTEKKVAHSADRKFWFSVKKRHVSGYRIPQKKLSFREKSKNEYFLIFTRNPLFTSFFDLLTVP
jgi:hypothetical protein